MKTTLLSVLFLLISAVSFGQCSDLFFSEYIEGSSNNKALEIYNPTSSAIDLTGYSIERFNNGATTPSGTFNFPSVMLAAGDVYVIGNSSAVAGITNESDTLSTITFFNGDDALSLLNPLSDTLDIIGIIGIDPGAAWTVGTGATNNTTLVRSIGIQEGTTNWAQSVTEWDVFPIDSLGYLGSHSMTPCGPPVPVFGPCGELFFSEYIEGSSSNKALEIYNPTTFDIDMSNYVIYRANNGSLVPTDSLFPVGIIAAGDVFVVANPSANAAIMAEMDTTHTLCFYNGDDAVWMENMVSGDTLDLIGEIGVDPGAGWTVGTGATNNFTIVRMTGINQGETDWAVGSTQWDIYPIDMTDSLGAHSMTPCGAACSPTTFNQTIISCSAVVSPSGAYTWTTTGIYNDTIFDAGGCDSLYVVDLTIGTETTSTIADTACTSYISPSGQIWTATGAYMDTIPNALGCDSVVTVNLVIDPASAACANQCSELFFSEYIEGSSNNKALEIYNPTGGPIDLVDYAIKRHTNGSPTASGTYTFPTGTLIAAGDVYVIGNSAADSAGVLSVADTTNAATFFNGDDALILENVVSGDTIDVIGEVGVDPGSNWPVGSGATSEYTLVRSAAIQQGNNDWASAASEWVAFPQNTFDSLGSHSMIACTVLPCTVTDTMFTAAACSLYTSPSGIAWTASGIYNDTIQNAAGCDSVLVIDLTISNVTFASITETACVSFTAPSGAVLASTGTFTDIIPNSAGCDSVITIDLTITSIDVTTTVVDPVASANQAGADYQWIDCNGNMTISGETDQSFTAPVTGSYAVIVTLNGCSDTSACVAITVVGLDEFLGSELYVYPNPFDNEVTIDFGQVISSATLTVLSIDGKFVKEINLSNSDRADLAIDGPSGTYLVKIQSEGIEKVIRVVKN